MIRVQARVNIATEACSFAAREVLERRGQVLKRRENLKVYHRTLRQPFASSILTPFVRGSTFRHRNSNYKRPATWLSMQGTPSLTTRGP